jgi:GMP synthase-like glutamine amidotransferase
MKYVYIISGNAQYTALFASLGYSRVSEMDGADLVVFTGGEDVTPSLYGDKAHAQTYNSTDRDAQETRLFKAALERHIPMVGICRGAQFLNVMSGGRMYQHVTGHLGDHDLVDQTTGDNILVSSTHHQMMMPSDKAIILAVANLEGSREWYDGQVAKRDISNTDYEVVYYPNTNALCFQPHPEFVARQYQGMRKYFTELVEHFCHVEETSTETS